MTKAKKKEKAPSRNKAADKPVVKSAVEAASHKKAEIKITAAEGRLMLTWVGKRPLSHVTAFPARHVETFSPSHSELRTPHSGPTGPALIPKAASCSTATTKEVLAHLLANSFGGKVRNLELHVQLLTVSE
ncbi:MAG: hypothetical protein OHK006_16170 [Thermodesulfovibrionales bacterium]